MTLSSLPSIRAVDFKLLPESTGVYVFYRRPKSVLYVGSAGNLRKRIVWHHVFSNQAERRGLRIAWVETCAEDRYRIESELYALLKPRIGKPPAHRPGRGEPRKEYMDVGVNPEIKRKAEKIARAKGISLSRFLEQILAPILTSL